MAQLDRATLEAFFESGDFPTESQFADLIESTVNIVDDSPPLTFSKSITSAEILAINTTPQVIIPAQGANSVIRPLVITAQLTFVTSAYAIPLFSKMEYHETSLAGTLIAEQLSGFLTAVATTTEAAALFALAQALLPNTPLVLGNTVGDPTLGDGTLVIKALASIQQF